MGYIKNKFMGKIGKFAPNSKQLNTRVLTSFEFKKALYAPSIFEQHYIAKTNQKNFFFKHWPDKEALQAKIS